jgi:hypothetical protein
MHPEALVTFRALLMPILEIQARTGNEQQQAKSRENLESLRKSSAQAFFTGMMSWMLTRPEYLAMRTEREVVTLGHVVDGEMAHVVYRVSGADVALGGIKVISLKREGNEWKLFLPGDLGVMMQPVSETAKRQLGERGDASVPVQKPYDLEATYKGFRDLAFSGKAAQTLQGLAPNEPYGVIVEIGHAKGAVTVFALRDGTASVYFSTGGGGIGGKGREEIRSAAVRLVERAGPLVSQMQVAPDREVVRRGMVRAWALLQDRLLMDETQLDSPKRGPALELFDFAQDILNGFRRLEQKR